MKFQKLQLSDIKKTGTNAGKFKGTSLEVAKF